MTASHFDLNINIKKKGKHRPSAAATENIGVHSHQIRHSLSLLLSMGPPGVQLGWSSQHVSAVRVTLRLPIPSQLGVTKLVLYVNYVKPPHSPSSQRWIWCEYSHNIKEHKYLIHFLDAQCHIKTNNTLGKVMTA